MLEKFDPARNVARATNLIYMLLMQSNCWIDWILSQLIFYFSYLIYSVEFKNI